MLRKMSAALEDYNYLRHHGYLRYIVLRESHFAGKLMCNLVLSRAEEPAQEICEELCTLADSASLLVHDGLADLSFGPVLRDLKGGCYQ
jgi:hypothetical protein